MTEPHPRCHDKRSSLSTSQIHHGRIPRDAFKGFLNSSLLGCFVCSTKSRRRIRNFETPKLRLACCVGAVYLIEFVNGLPIHRFLDNLCHEPAHSTPVH